MGRLLNGAESVSGRPRLEAAQVMGKTHDFRLDLYPVDCFGIIST